MSESRLKSSLLLTSTSSTTNTSLKPSLLSSSLLSTSSLQPKTTLSTSTTTSSSLNLGLFKHQELSSEARKKKSDLSTSTLLEIKKPKITTTTTSNLIETRKVALLTHSIPTQNAHLSPISTVSANLKSEIFPKPVLTVTLNKPDVKPSPVTNLKRQHSDAPEAETIEEFEFTILPEALINSIESQLNSIESINQARKRIKAQRSIPDPLLLATRLQSPQLDLIAAKNALINAVSGSLIREPNFKNAQDSTRLAIITLAERVSQGDAQFLLKLALYTRRELNIRVTANFLISLASFNERARPYLYRFFKQAIMLPSDWIDVAEQYQLFMDKRINFGALPSALRKCMVEKFPDFDQYQLAKYNKEKSRLAYN